MNLLNRIVDPIEILPIKRNHIYRKNKLNFHKSKSFCLVINDVNWNKDFINPVNKLRKSDIGVEAAELEQSMIIFNRYDDFDMQIPAIISVQWYKEVSLKKNLQILLANHFKNELIKENQINSGKSLNIFNQEVAGTEVKLNIDGELTVRGDVNFQDREIISMNQTESSNWDLDIEQTQKFGIDGTIGDRIFIEIDQDSEATFSWDNDLSLEYRGKENDILKKAQGGNISLSLPASQFVSVGSGKNEGLFGIKLAHAIGPLTINTILSREQVKKSQEKYTGGEASGENELNDYHFIRGVYFFIDEKFKNQFYPLNNNGEHYIDNNYVVSNIIVYKTVSQYDVNVKSNVEAYIDPSDTTNSYSQKGGLWVKMDDKIDYDINRKEGWIRLNNVGSDEAVGIAYTLGTIDPSNPDIHIDSDSLITYTDINDTQDDYCLIEGWELGDSCGDESDGSEDFNELNEIPGFQQPEPLQLKLIKDTYLQGQLQPTSPSWELMFKNVYSLGSANIDLQSLEIEIVHDKGAGLIHTHNPESGKSYSNIFGIDKEDGNYQYVEGGDGKVDIRQTIIDDVRGELFLPYHLPFSYDNIGRQNSTGDAINQFGELISSESDEVYWGNNSQELIDIIDISLDDPNNNCCYDSEDSDQGPKMYYDNSSNYTPNTEFVISTKFSSSSRSSVIKLSGFMIVPDSETVTLNGVTLKRGSDYSINYDSGTIDFSNQQATDPTANLVITYEENEIISFDQKLLAGTHLKYDFNEYSFLTGGLYYYNQSIVNDKVNVGSEPMRNFIWNIAGRYKQELDFLTTGVNMIPFIETSKASNFNIEGEYAEVYPNPNPLGQAFIDDFESSKRTTSPNILSRQWKRSSIPDEDNFDNYIRSHMSWYNPYNDILTQNIWPNQETSSRANNERTKTLWLQTYFPDQENDLINWNGISTTLFDYNQERSKYIDVWLNDSDINNADFKLHIDIGQISEDQDGDGKFDSEDQALYGGGVGNKKFDLGEDTGLDGCFDLYETGFGYNNFDDNSHSQCLDGGLLFAELCNIIDEDISIEDIISLERCNELKSSNIPIDDWDPNGDNFIYIEGSEDYRFSNGTEGNSIAYPYLDTEDLNKSEPYYSLDILNDYFTIEVDFESLYQYTQSESINGWKLIRIPLSHFSKKGRQNVEWGYVQNMRLWVESESNINNILKIAKIEIVGNEWQELGSTHIDSLYYSESFIPDSTFKVEVINTDENAEYIKPTGVVQEVDEYTGLTLREQSLVISFDQEEGIADSSIIAIKKTLNQLDANNRNSFLAYEKMNMYVFGGDPKNPGALFVGGNTDIELLFRIGKDENYYEITQKIHENWDERNQIDIDIAQLNQLKIPLNNNPGEELNDVGLDGCINDIETGFGSCLDSLTFDYWCNIENDSLTNYTNLIPDSAFVNINTGESIPINIDRCIELLNDPFITLDPNGDDFIDLDGDGIVDPDEEGQENNNQFDFIDLDGDGQYLSEGEAEPAINDYDGNNIFSNLAEYDVDNDLFYWNDNINHVCGNCSELRIKGSPAVNNLEYVVVGVINKSGDNKAGKVLIDELRMTGVKKEKGTAFRLSSAINFADFLSISSSYERKDADFHLLQERLGLGQNTESYNINTSFNPDLFLPSGWGIKTPVSINYSHSLSSPKLIQGTDILAGTIERADKDIQTVDDKITLSTSFRKSTRSRNWFNKYTIDNLFLRFSVINGEKSTSTIELEEYFDYEYYGSYEYKFNKDNYINAFSLLSGIPIIGEPLSAIRLYYSPDEIKSSVGLDEYDKTSKQRTSLEPTVTYSLNMSRNFELKYKLSNSITSKYKRAVSSNYDNYKDSKINLIKNLDSGLIKSVTESLTNSYSPNYLKWLGPKFTYNPSFTWNLVNQSSQDSISSTAKITAKAPLNLDFKIKPKDLMKKIYDPNGKHGRLTKYSIGFLYDVASKLSNGISIDFENTRTNSYDNIYASDRQDYWYRLGIEDRPSILNYSIENANYKSSSSIKNSLAISTTLKLTNKYIINNIKHIKSSEYLNNSNQPNQNITFKQTVFPLGMNGDEGFPFVDWNISWSMMDNDLLKKYFKTMSFRNNHSTSKTEQWQGNALQTWNYIQDFNPLFGFEFKTLGKNWWHLDIGIIRKLSISNTSSVGTSPTSRDYTNTLTFDLSHFRKGGIKIPLLLVEDFYFDNDITFDLDTEYSHNYKIIDPGNAKSIDDFIEESSQRIVTIEPIISYNFTTWVNGNVHFLYKITDDKVQGRTEVKDIGFYLSFKIRG